MGDWQSAHNPSNYKVFSAGLWLAVAVIDFTATILFLLFPLVATGYQAVSYQSLGLCECVNHDTVMVAVKTNTINWY